MTRFRKLKELSISIRSKFKNARVKFKDIKYKRYYLLFILFIIIVIQNGSVQSGLLDLKKNNFILSLNAKKARNIDKALAMLLQNEKLLSILKQQIKNDPTLKHQFDSNFNFIIDQLKLHNQNTGEVLKSEIKNKPISINHFSLNLNFAGSSHLNLIRLVKKF